MTADHPRSRGEYSTQQTSTRLMHGSSPLSRGILPPVVIAVQPWGIIPALAGNTFPVPRWPLTCWDHPRSRGEYVDRWNDRVRVFGSSPLSRGILTPHVGRVLARRIIPALAGNTTAVTCVRAWGWDHPRSRGEYAPWTGHPSTHRGSSPLSRGIRSGILSLVVTVRIIPALAGNTTGYAMLPGRLRDHPRSRGEYYWHTGKNKLCIGSSPLSRGILD